MTRHVLIARSVGVIAFLGATFLIAAAVGMRPDTPTGPAGMALIEGGKYLPLYGEADEASAERVAPFYLDRHPVTNAEYRAFVLENAAWRKSRVPSLMADDAYLREWPSDLDFGPDSLANRPVVNVSWFAARAYADWKGMRLPTTAEWEVAAAAGLTRDEPADAIRQRLLTWYARPAGSTLPPVGSTECNYWGACDLHGLVWEWVEDFNSALVTGESRNDGDLDLRQFCGSAAVNANDFDDYAAFLRFGFRSGLEAKYTVRTLGFRLAADLPPDA